MRQNWIALVLLLASPVVAQNAPASTPAAQGSDLLEFHISPEKTVYSKNEPLLFDVEICNKSDAPIVIMTGGFRTDVRFQLESNGADVVADPTKRFGPMSIGAEGRELKPHVTVKGIVDLRSRGFVLGEGSYVLKATFFARFTTSVHVPPGEIGNVRFTPVSLDAPPMAFHVNP